MKQAHIDLLGENSYKRLASFSMLPPGWERNAKTLNPISLHYFTQFLDEVIKQNKFLPQDSSIFMQQDGFISFQWDTPSNTDKIIELAWSDIALEVFDEEAGDEVVHFIYESIDYVKSMASIIESLPTQSSTPFVSSIKPLVF